MVTNQLFHKIPKVYLQIDHQNKYDIFISCSGYTGEDGFELATNSDDALELAQLLLDQTEVQPAGLGARDSLRLEAGLCLHGNDIHPNVTPVAAGLSWAIPASRRKGGSKTGGFPGSEPILLELENGMEIDCDREDDDGDEHVAHPAPPRAVHAVQVVHLAQDEVAEPEHHEDREERERQPVSYTHLTLPTKRIV